jgi:dipeptidyl aminopeptidase/acylaminoacyl peptidase
MMHKSRLTAAILAALLMSTTVLAAPADERFWTLEDIVTVPEVTELALSEDRRFAVYAVRAADIAANKNRWTLRIVDLNDGTRRDLVGADQAEQLKRIPGSDDWSALLDIGEGMQLYRIERSGRTAPLLVHRPTVYAGSADMALPDGAVASPRQIGILAYDWSPDGQWLWYSVLKAEDGGGGVRFDTAVVAERQRRRSQIGAKIEIHIRAADGHDSIVTTRSSSDRAARYFGGEIMWRGDEVFFRAEEEDGTDNGRFETRAWSLSRQTLRTVNAESNGQTVWVMTGPRGGQLASKGVGARFELVEGFEDGRQHSYGRFPFLIGDPRGVGIHLAADERSALVGTRTTGNNRYGLALVNEGGVRAIGGNGSFTRCDFSSDLAVGICIREGMAMPPELVRVEPERNRITRLATVSVRHAAITPLAIRPRIWVNRLGYEASGYVVLPRGYVAGRRYPAIIVTHGSDADERFAYIGFQWDYPVQLFAERGYVVLLINDPRSRQNAEIWSAYQAWSRGDGPPGPADVQRLLWLNGVYSFEDAVKEMTAEGVVDPDRVGIAGFSRGSQMVNVTLTHSKMFRAASGGDGSFLEPFSYPGSPRDYKAIYGGPPFGEHIENYRRFAPSLNADKACGALLQQVVKPRTGAIDIHEALRAGHVPSQLTLYPGESAASDETHVFHIPSNRLKAQRENVAWFDYWLLGRRDPAMVFPERLAVWDAMADAPGRPACNEPVRATD